MKSSKTAAVILAAGQGTRMKSALPKVLHPIAGRPMLQILLDTVAEAGLGPVSVVVGKGMDAVADAARPHPTAIQDPPRGTAHAVLAAKDALSDHAGDVLVLFGADPLIRPDTIKRLLKARKEKPEPAVVVLGYHAQDPKRLGRLVLSGDGDLEAIVEAADATAEQLAIRLCNSGVMLVSGQHVWDLLSRVTDDNAKKEFYLTDIVALARADGLRVAVVEGDETELMGIDSRADLARAEAVMQERLRLAVMDAGATLADPETVYFSYDTKLGQDVTVGPNVQFGPGVVVGDGAEIVGFCHIEGAAIAPGARIGPFARLRPGAEVGEGARIGNFVEIKAASIEAGAKVNHLSYVGDARVGAGANVGAGTITCNYDGFAKSRTDIGDGAFIGSNTALVAPVTVGARAMIGAGSVITKDVAPDSLAVTRAPQRETKGGAARIARSRGALAKSKAKKAKEKN